jgi:hypothetical protein
MRMMAPTKTQAAFFLCLASMATWSSSTVARPEDDSPPKLPTDVAAEQAARPNSVLCELVCPCLAARRKPEPNEESIVGCSPVLLAPETTPSHDIWEDLSAGDLTGRSVQKKAEVPWVSWNSQLAYRDVPADPNNPRPEQNWHSDESLRLSVTHSLYVFSQMGAGCDCMTTQETRLTTRTGVEYKLPTWLRGELLVRGGPAVTWDDTLRREHTQEHSEVLLEVQGKWPIWNQLKLEYNSSAAPALHPAEHDHLNQDLLVAFPVGSGQLRVGAKHNWDNLAENKPSLVSTQLYLGFSLTR